MATTLEGLTERFAALRTQLDCVGCDAVILPLDALTMGGDVYCCDCAWEQAAALLSAYLVPAWSPADTAVSAKDYDEARRIVGLLLARIDARRARRA